MLDGWMLSITVTVTRRNSTLSVVGPINEAFSLLYVTKTGFHFKE